MNLDPFMIHETFLCLTETVFGSHPYRVVSVTYRKLRPFHGGGNARDGDCGGYGHTALFVARKKAHKTVDLG